MQELHLGKESQYESQYNPQLLTPISRDLSRLENNINEPLPFAGVDIWNAWELSWLNNKGKPEVASACLEYSAYSTHLIESKSLKLYLNSFNQTKFSSKQEVLALLIKDLSSVTNSEVNVSLYSAKENWPKISDPIGRCIDDLDINVTEYEVNSEYLSAAIDHNNDNSIIEHLCSHLFKSNCMITGQPDWASVFIHYKGTPIDHSLLLKYLISYRTHQAFHEPCAERIFMDISQFCQTEELSVYCRYTRRGGLDINPFRYSKNCKELNVDNPSNLRVWRQ